MTGADEGARPDGVTRREALAALGAAPLVALSFAALGPSEAVIVRAWRTLLDAPGDPAPYAPRFFAPHEWRTVRILADLIIPRDERSGSACDARVPEFIDFMMTDQPEGQVPMRGGLRWLDSHCHDRFGAAFADCTPTQRSAVLDDLAWPARARPELAAGVAFFTRFRDLTASGFWSSRIGVADLGYLGNTVVPEWTGCPEPALIKLGVRYGPDHTPPNAAPPGGAAPSDAPRRP